MKKHLIFLIILIVYPAFPQGDELPGGSYSIPNQLKRVEVPAAVKAKTNVFFNQLLDSNITKAYDDLMQGSFLNDQKEKIRNLVTQTQKAFEIYGKLKGFEIVVAEEVTKSFVRVHYLGKHSKFPMRWIFTFYNSPDKGWVVTNVKFDDLSELYFDK